MRDLATKDRIMHLLEEIGRRSRGPGRIYLTGGTTAVLIGWRATTHDVDLKLDPEPPGVFEAIRDLKEELSINVELAAPDHFIPELPDWRQRSIHVGRFGEVDVYHYDLYAQALSKIERGHVQDLEDVRQLVALGRIAVDRLVQLYAAIEPALVRYPAIDAPTFRCKVEEFVAGCH